jgi:arylsulfatase A-like enzyme
MNPSDHFPQSLALPRSAVRALLLIALGLAVLGGCARRADPDWRGRQAIVILLDAARPDRLSCYGYKRETTPNLDRLAASGVVAENHFSQATATRAWLPTFLYSRYFAPPLMPNSRFVPVVEPENLFRTPDGEAISLPRALAAAGIRTAAASAHIWIKEGSAFVAEFDEFHDLVDHFDTDLLSPNAEQVVKWAIDWIADHLDQEYFLYLHLMDTHFPHRFDVDARAFYGTDEPPPRGWHRYGRPADTDAPLDGKGRRYLDALYDGSLRRTDRELGRLFAFLAKQGRLASTLIAVTSDHGEHLLEVAGRFEHDGPWYDTVARTPLLIHYPPRLAPARVSAFTEGIDIYPTILGLLGVPLPAGKSVDGLDLTPELTGSPGRRAAVCAPGGIRTSTHKLIVPVAGDLLAAPEDGLAAGAGAALFDLRADPHEVENLLAAEPGVAQALLQEYRRRLSHSFRRYRDAVSGAQPTQAFAIAARHFLVDPQARDLSDRSAESDSSFWELQDGWTMSRHAYRYYLQASGVESPVEIAFKVPDGIYDVAAGMMGRATLQPAGASASLPLNGEPFDPQRFMNCPTVEVGRIEIRDHTFQARLTPLPDEGRLLLRYLGFRPSGAEPVDSRADSLQIQRLRALGYVN